MKLSDCCQKGCLKMWLLVTQLLITVIYMVYFCLLIFSYDTTFDVFSQYFPDEASIKLGIGIIFAVAVYLVLNTFCGCCVAWQPEKCFYMTFVICTVICMAFVLAAALYSLIKYSYYPIGFIFYELIAAFSIFLAYRIKNIEDDPHYMTLLEEMIEQQAQELYSYRGPQSLEEEEELKATKLKQREASQHTHAGSVHSKEAGFFDFRRDTVMITKLSSG